MPIRPHRLLPLTFILSLAGALMPAQAAIYSVDIPAAPAPGQQRFMGQAANLTTAPPAATSPTGSTIGYNNLSFLKDGKPWLPVMGEIHFSRYPAAEWRTELLKMKAGGVSLISTYVFWIHHEEEQGKFTWDGDKNLHDFIKTCGELGLPVIVRVGPWCHGEVRNGGFPDWVQALPRKRTNDPAYLAAVKPYYDQIGLQLKGQLWKDGGPVIGIQFENEFKGPAAHLETLKQMGLAAGMDVPIYTRTAWDNATNLPFGEVLPLWGGYAEGFWDRTLDTMPGNYWQVFQFARERGATDMGANPTGLPTAAATGPTDIRAYPYLTCELGGGMMSSYHRRIDIKPMDVLSVALTKIGSGSNMPGYYMYHGGTNPDAKLSTLMESQSPPQNMWNDMPEKTYDFGAPLGEFGQVRESYNLTRRLHLFLADYGAQLATMPAYLGPPAKNKTDSATLRWSVRSDGQSGFLFVNNYQRALDMPAKPDTQFDIKLAKGGEVKFSGVTIPANSSFIWPINMDLGGVTLACATAMPICHIPNPGDPNSVTHVFTEIPGIPTEFVFEKGTSAKAVFGQGEGVVDAQGRTHLTLKAGEIIEANNKEHHVTIMLLPSQDPSYYIYKGTLNGHEQLIVSHGWNVTMDGKRLVLSGDGAKDGPIAFIPDLGGGLPSLISGALKLTEKGNAIQPEFAPADPLTATSELLQPAGPPREIPMGSQKVATEPTDADFAGAQPAIFKIKLPAGLADLKNARALLRLTYTGDVARLYLGDKLIDDNFYNGTTFDLGLWRYAPDIYAKELTLKILPLKKGAPIYMATWPTFPQGQDSLATLDKTEIVVEQTVTLEAK